MDSKLRRLFKTSAFIFILNLILALPASFAQEGQTEPKEYDWKKDWWLVEDGFKLSMDAKGFNLPTAITFVPEPGPDPKDPLYFVTELRGKIKVVTNDRTVYTFANLEDDEFHFTPKEELPSGLGQGGLAGVGLDPEHGYVFVTFLYRDKYDIMRNNIVRFQSEPGKFSISPSGKIAFTEIFNTSESGLAHQIGPAIVKDGHLYVSVGEGWQAFKTEQIDQMYGKIIRMTLDGKPVPENPFYKNDSLNLTENFVWAYGLRNPFGLKFVDDRLFAADNGLTIDRFLEIFKGENYHWNGSDNSIAMNADYIWAPSVGPVQMDFYPRNSPVFPQAYNESFFVAMSGAIEVKKMPGIFMIKYSMEKNKIAEVPKTFVKYKGESWQMVTGLAFGPDGLYFSPIFPDPSGESRILKVTFDGENKNPYTLVQNEAPFQLLIEKGCVGCHSIDGEYDYGGGAAPPITTGNPLIKKISARVFSDGYISSLQKVDESSDERHVSFKAARSQLIAASDSLERVKIWLENYLLEPQFDKTYQIQMPNVGLTPQEAKFIAKYLLKRPKEKPFMRRMLYYIKPPYGKKHMALAIFGSFFGGIVLSWLYVRRRKKSLA